ncbi:MAG: Gldg family protein [Spirochaetales bacterium]|nr:Gldg family protein [Spirochaetales bacterium]
MNKRSLFLSLPLLLLNLPVLMSGQTGLLFPLLWLTALLITPFFTAPLVAGEVGRGTDLLLLTQPLTDRELIRRLYRRGCIAFLNFLLIPTIAAALVLLFYRVDGGTILLSLLTMVGGVFLFTAIGLVLSFAGRKSVMAWLFTYLILLPLNFFPALLPRWTDPLFSGYLPFGAPLLGAGVLFLAEKSALALLARKREEKGWQRKNLLLLPILPVLFVFGLIPGGMDMTFTGQIRLNRVTARQIRRLEDPLYIRWYRTSHAGEYASSMESLEGFLFSLRLKSGLSLRYELVDLSDEEIRTLGEENSWMGQTVQAGGAYETFYSAWEIEYHGRTETLPLVYNPLIAEEQLLAALQRLSENRLPEAGILIGRSDRAEGDFWTVLQGSLAEYFRVTDYTGAADTLAEGTPDCLFVLGGRDLSAWEVDRILSYVEEGGAALVTLSSLELDPVQTDRIDRAQESPLTVDLARLGIYPGESFISDPDRGLYLSSDEDSPPDFYPLWFSTGDRGLYDYQALWSVPLYYTGREEILWQTDSSPRSYMAAPLTDLTPASLYGAGKSGEAAYTTCLSLSHGKGILTVISGEESLSNLMALADREMSNSAWIQTVAFFLSGNEDLLELRQKSLGRKN